MTAPPVLLTPEGAELRFADATASERIVAFGLDAIAVLLVLLVGSLVLAPMLGAAPVLLLVFFARQFWFAWFETRRNGSTPGKRRFNLRVIRADGGPLTTEIVLARNLTREVELFLPLQLLAAPDFYDGEHAGLIALLAWGWVLLLLFFPLTNRQRLRVGDLLAGTRVVVVPPARLLRDLAARPAGTNAAAAGDDLVFREAHLRIYGIRELDVLEDVLRKATAPGAKETLAAVAASIQKRIGWTPPAKPPEDLAFLRAFYAAQRRHLEHHLLLGRRRERKGDGPAPKG